MQDASWDAVASFDNLVIQVGFAIIKKKRQIHTPGTSCSTKLINVLF